MTVIFMIGLTISCRDECIVHLLKRLFIRDMSHRASVAPDNYHIIVLPSYIDIGGNGGYRPAGWDFDVCYRYAWLEIAALPFTVQDLVH